MNTLADYRRANLDAPFDVLLASDEWRPVIELANNWLATPISAKTGVSIEEINQHEAASGRKWPAALKEVHRLLGKHEFEEDEESGEGHTWLKHIGRDPRWLGLYEEVQECWYCGILNEHCDHSDPPVYFQSTIVDLVEDWHFEPHRVIEGRFVKVAESLTSFIRGMLIRYIGFGFGRLKNGVTVAMFAEDYRPDYARLQQEFDLHQALDFPAGYHPFISPENDFILIQDWGVAALTSAKFERVASFVQSEGGSFREQRTYESSYYWHKSDGPLPRCPRCDVALIVDFPLLLVALVHWEELRSKHSLHRIAMPGGFEQLEMPGCVASASAEAATCDAVYVGDAVTDDLRCPKCDASIAEAIRSNQMRQN